jgi:hypothetical protein
VESDNRKAPRPILLNGNLPTVFIDNLNITTRGDGLYFMRLFAALPEGLKEEYRIMVPNQALKSMIDVLCAHIGYYPEKPAKERASALK